MSNGDFKRYRAMKGADAAAKSRRFYMRKIVREYTDDRGMPMEELDCGHSQRPKEDMIGRTYAERRRCTQCPIPECVACQGRGRHLTKTPAGLDLWGDDCEVCHGRGVIPSEVRS